MTLQLSLEEFLVHNGIDVSSLVKAVDNAVRLERGETLFLSGSLTEGLGNHFSDLDFYLVTTREVPTLPGIGIVTFACGFAIGDLEFHSPERITNFLQELDQWRDPANEMNTRSAVGFAGCELLHRVRVGVPLVNEEAFRELQERVDARALCRVGFEIANQMVTTSQQDLAGVLSVNDPASTLFAAQRFLGFTVDCLLAALGNTNPKAKWRARLLSELALPGWDEDLPGGPLGEDAASFFVRLGGTPVVTLEDARKLTQACVCFANRVVPWAQRRFAACAVTDFVHRGAPDPSSDVPLDPLPALAPDVQIRWERGELLVLSLRRQRAIPINPLTHEILCHLDGQSTIDHLRQRVPRLSNGSRIKLASAVSDLTILLAGSGFLE